LLIRDGEKMSKSKGNVVNPAVPQRYTGAILSARINVLGPFHEGWRLPRHGDHRRARIPGAVWRLVIDTRNLHRTTAAGMNELGTLHRTIKKVTADYENLRYNKAIARADGVDQRAL
jgi:leucyl-tRNA synthetase